MKRKHVFGLIVLLCMSAMFVTGCKPKAPTGNAGGRMSVYDAEPVADPDRANMSDLYECSDVAAEQFARDISKIPEVQAAETQLILEIGGILNKTVQTDSADFEMIQRRLISKLNRSPLITDNFMIVEKARRMDAEFNNLYGQQNDLLQEGNAQQTNRYDPKKTYILNGTFYEARRRGVNRYFFEFTVTSVATRRMVFSKSYDSAIRR